MKKYFTAIIVVITCLVIYMFWYNKEYSMNIAKSFTLHDSSMESKVLIATQGSEYKNHLVATITESQELQSS